MSSLLPQSCVYAVRGLLGTKASADSQGWGWGLCSWVILPVLTGIPVKSFCFYVVFCLIHTQGCVGPVCLSPLLPSLPWDMEPQSPPKVVQVPLLSDPLELYIFSSCCQGLSLRERRTEIDVKVSTSRVHSSLLPLLFPLPGHMFESWFGGEGGIDREVLIIQCIRPSQPRLLRLKSQ